MFVVFLSSKYYEPLMADVPRWSKDHNQSALDGFSILHCDSASSTFLHGLSGRNMWNSFDMLNHASTTQKIVCSFELSLFSCLQTLVYQLIVRSMCAFVHRCLLLLWSVKPFHSEWLGETNSSTSSISRIGSKKLCSADQIANPAFVLLYLGVLPSLYRDCYRNCTPSYELLVQWYFSPSLVIPRPSCWCNRNTDKWVVMCEINTPSNLVAW